MRVLFLVLILLIVSFISLFVGNQAIAPSRVFGMDEIQFLVFTVSRIPRTLALLLSGAGIAVAGFIMQQIAQNKFVSPTTAGSLDAAKLGILVGLLWFPHLGLIQKILLSLLFCFAAGVAFILLIKRLKIKNVILIPLIGIMFGSILSAIATFFAIKYNIVQNVEGWLIGDFSGVLQGQYETIYLIFPVVIVTYILANQFTLIGMGENFSKNLGLNYNTYMFLGLLCVSLTVSVTVVTVGTIPFLGLIVPNVVRIYKGDNLKKVLPLTAWFGAVFLLVCDILGRIIIAPYEIPIGLMVGMLGGLIFFLLLMRINK